MASQPCAQLRRLALLAQLIQLATQRFDAGRLPTAHDRPEITAQHVFDAFNARLLQQRQTKQFGKDLLDSKAHHACQLVDLRRQFEQAYHLQRGIEQHQPQITAGHGLARC